MDLKQLVGVAGVPLVVALVDIIKGVGAPSKFSPFYAIGVAIVLNVLLAIVLGLNIVTAVVVGLVVGGLASGYYDVIIKN